MHFLWNRYVLWYDSSFPFSFHLRRLKQMYINFPRRGKSIISKLSKYPFSTHSFPCSSVGIRCYFSTSVKTNSFGFSSSVSTSKMPCHSFGISAFSNEMFIFTRLKNLDILPDFLCICKLLYGFYMTTWYRIKGIPRNAQ